MKKLLSIAVLACFVLISALATFGDVDAYAASEDAGQTQVSTKKLPDASAQSSVDDPSYDGKRKDAEKDDCPCEKDSGVTKFVCGVTLAPANHSVMVHPPLLAASLYVSFETIGLKSFVDLLERPPRPLL